MEEGHATMEGLNFEAKGSSGNVESFVLCDKDSVKIETLNEIMRKNESLSSHDMNARVSSDGVEDEGLKEYGVGEIVWGKVRTHPWWPGQICDPLDASEMARKCCKKGRYLIAYFGDQSFAWNEAAKIKPFLENCSKMEKQSDKDEFRNAVDCALVEVSRRVEFGLACCCVSVEEYAKLKTQKIFNAAFRKEAASRTDGGDSSLTVAFFEPPKVIKFIKKYAQLPNGKADRLELVTCCAQISAFRRWKSYVPFSEKNETDVSFLGEKNRCNEASVEALSLIENEKLVRKQGIEGTSLHECMNILYSTAQKMVFPSSESEGKAESELISQGCNKRKDLNAIDEDVLPVIKDGKLVGILETKDNSLHKCWQLPEDEVNLSEEAQIFNDLMGMDCFSNLMNENGLQGNFGTLISEPSSKKQKGVDVIADDGAVEHVKSYPSQGIGSNLNNTSFGVEEFFNRFLN